MITIEVAPKPRGTFAAFVNGKLVATSTTPFLTVARVLLRDGVDPEAPISMRHKGSNTIALTSTVGRAAGVIVRNSDRATPRFEKDRTVCEAMILPAT